MEILQIKQLIFLNQGQFGMLIRLKSLRVKMQLVFIIIQSAVDASGGDARSWAAKNMMPEFLIVLKKYLLTSIQGCWTLPRACA